MGRKPQTAYLMWDAAALLDFFGGTVNKIKLNALSAGLPVPSSMVVAQWRYRKTISTNGIAFFTMLAAAMEPPVDMKRFIRFSTQPMTYDDAGDGEGPEDGDELGDGLLTDEEIALLDAMDAGPEPVR
jgi:hypothetical protein